MCCESPEMSTGSVILKKTIDATNLSLSSLATGKLLCDPFLFEDTNQVLYAAASKGELLQVQLTETSSGTPITAAIRLHFFAPNDAAISAGMIASTFTIGAPAKWLGSVDIASGDYITVGAYAQATVFPKLHLFSGAANSKITVVAVTNGSVDYATSAALSLSLAVKQNF